MSQASEDIARQFFNANLNKRTWSDLIYNAKALGCACDDETDDTDSLNALINMVIANGGGTIKLPGLCKVTSTLYFSGTIPAKYEYPELPTLTIDGGVNGGISSYITSGDIIRLGSSTAKMNFRLVLKDLIIDGNRNEVTAINGYSYLTPHNNLVMIDNVVLRGLEGPNSEGFKCGDITDSFVNRLRVQGSGSGCGKGVIPRRSNIKFFDSSILYCVHGVYLMQFGEANMQFIGGALAYNQHHITFQGGGNVYNTNYFFGTFIGEMADPSFETIYCENPTGADINTLVFEGCLFDSSRASEPMILLDFGGKVSFINCANWIDSTVKKIYKGEYCELVLIGNRNLELDSTSPTKNLVNKLFEESGGDVNAIGGFKQTLSFYMDNVPANAPGSRLNKNAGSVQDYLMNFSGSILAVGVYSNATRTAGSFTVQMIKNGVGMSGAEATIDATNTQTKITTINKDTISFVAGDRIGVVIYSSADWTPTTADITVEVTVEY